MTVSAPPAPTTVVWYAMVRRFLADGAEGLQHFNEHGICVNDFKQDNIIVCHADNPCGFVGKLADPGLWCGK